MKAPRLSNIGLSSLLFLGACQSGTVDQKAIPPEPQMGRTPSFLV